MNNEEKNPAVDNEVINEAVESNKQSAPATSANKIPGSVIGMIVGGFVFLIVAIVLLVTLFPGNNDQGGEGNNGGGNTDEKVKYVVTVVDQDGNAVKGASVTFTPKGATAIPLTTDSNGKASYKSDKEITATVTEIPAGYKYDKLNVAQNFDKDGNLNITITKPAPFVILVVDQNGNAVSGVKVQMCDTTGSCRMPVTTNAEGKGTYNYEEGEFKAQLSNGLKALPEGYTSNNPDEYVYFVDGVATIVVIKTAD